MPITACHMTSNAAFDAAEPVSHWRLISYLLPVAVRRVGLVDDCLLSVMAPLSQRNSMLVPLNGTLQV